MNKTHILMLAITVATLVSVDAAESSETSSQGKPAPKPLFRDPVHDGAADPVVIWNRPEQKWFMFYTNRRANLTNSAGVEWVHGTRIGIAESGDRGATWSYRGTAEIHLGKEAETHWAPDVIEHEGRYHMFLTLVPGVFRDWNAPRDIVHLTSTNLLNWKYESTLKLASDRVIDASVFRLPDGSWRMWYNNERDRKSIYYADSPDLFTWTDKGKAIGDRSGEGPKVFRWKDSYWMVVDNWRGLGIYRSEDLLNWTRQPQNLLAQPGTGPDDGVIGQHPDAVVNDGRAFLFYFTHPGRRGEGARRDGCEQRRSSIQVVELEFKDGEITCDRDRPTYIKLTPPAAALGETKPCILTPPAPATPCINGPKVFGVRPGSPFLYSIPATGERPMTFAADGLPEGLKLDPVTGRITGTLNFPGEHKVALRATNAVGAAEKPFRIVVGEKIALTPPMGWNSYNCFGVHVTQDKALRAARAFIKLGLDRHGWTYINLDDGWQGERGGPLHALQPDPERFPDIKAMVDEIHALGLKAGLYHSPWTITYGNRPGGSAENPEGRRDPAANLKARKNAKVLPFAIGKYRFTYQDARQFAEWGFDYLKHDWGPVEAPETREMHQALRVTGRDIVLSLSNNHVKNLFKGIAEVSPWAQSWRTTTDISDNWKRVAFDIGFAQDPWAPFARPGHHNDADMLVVGHVGGWGNQLRPTRLTPDEQYTHISLWCLLASPLLIGCELERMDEFTLSLLTNDEVLEVNHDSLGQQATCVSADDNLRVFAKDLDDGSKAVGLFNLGDRPATVVARWDTLKLSGAQGVRDLWRQKDLGRSDKEFSATVAPHGVVLVKISKTSN